MKKTLILVIGLLAFSNSNAETFNCMVKRIQVNSDRFYVECHSSWKNMNIPPFVKDIPFYSVSYSQKNARWIYDLIIEARGRGKSVRLISDNDSKNSPSGCKGNNCRRIIGLAMYY